MVYFSLNILREHQVGWSSFRLTTGHFSVIENTKIGAVLGTGFLPGVGTVVGSVLGLVVANWVIELIDEL